ncbi:MAG TPA: bifunctional [glutamate--ammonia ligase]-adenylyl-L-tyrosine phosphorylase/[glutamate--ammonia-ligase] adenylyltransferase [Thiobacillaceae bacterium]|nr:bifunctional [glutamate--ammonia ligase]-adenylyl-L-tyrosine phosphorylase/[glutamate--ammonia-ligase] adenylyltransferase [Thiobacillaceae bacterium]
MNSKEHPIDRLARLSRHGSRLLAAQPELSSLAARLNLPYTRQEMDAALAQLPTDESELNARLRLLKHQVWTVTAARDLAGLADLDEVTGVFSDLAETAIQAALRFHQADLAERHGSPRHTDGSPMELTVVAMGKLGGRELNVSSDIDLIFLYPEEGETTGRQPLSHHEFFMRVGRQLISALGQNTADGYVFRVDMRLRPWGDAGPLAMSYSMLEEYLMAQGRAWERYAWIKARPVSGNRHAELLGLVRPFVFRKYLDFSAFAAMRDLHVQIRRDVARREMQHNIKLGPGGIREIEFAAQVFQLIRGGRLPSLQVRPTLKVLSLEANYGFLPQSASAELCAAYVFLRRLEHRIQYLDDAQTQLLPADSDSRERIAQMMNHADWGALLKELDKHRNKVTGHFEQIFSAPQTDQQTHDLAALWLAPDTAPSQLAQLGYADPQHCARQLGLLRTGLYERLSESARTKLNALIPPLIQMAADYDNPDDTLGRLLRLIETIARRTTYLALLTEYPAVLRQLCGLVSASPWAADLLTRQPILLDELIDPRQLLSAPDWRGLFRRLGEDLDVLEQDAEQQMDSLRRFKQVQTLRLLAQDVAGLLALERLSDHLSDLADGLLAEALKRVWAGFKQKHLDHPRFAIIGYGKLGGKELGYASDLDLVFLYDDQVAEAGVLYARFAQRIISWLSTATGAGVLYDTDLRLRPNGSSGLLVSSLAAFKEYQHHHAWVWEHQALTRARYVAGDAAIGQAFESLRHDILTLPRDKAKLKQEVIDMRKRMHDGHLNSSERFDLKHDAGGIVDVEFCVQYLVLAHARAYPQLLANVGNIALLRRCGEAGLLPADLANAAADAYRELRKLQHAAKLHGAREARLPYPAVGDLPATVQRLWQQVFGP